MLVDCCFFNVINLPVKMETYIHEHNILFSKFLLKFEYFDQKRCKILALFDIIFGTKYLINSVMIPTTNDAIRLNCLLGDPAL